MKRTYCNDFSMRNFLNIVIENAFKVKGKERKAKKVRKIKILHLTEQLNQFGKNWFRTRLLYR